MKTILLIVDMQNGFIRYEQTKNLVKNIKQLLKCKIFDVVIATKFLNQDGSMYEKLFNWQRLKSEEDRNICADLNNYIDEIFEKNAYTCVDSTFLSRLCNLNDNALPEKIFIVGVDTDCCILKIATDLFENDIRPIVLTKYCNSNGGYSSHEAGLLCLKRLIGEKQLIDKIITSSDDIENI